MANIQVNDWVKSVTIPACRVVQGDWVEDAHGSIEVLGVKHFRDNSVILYFEENYEVYEGHEMLAVTSFAVPEFVGL